MWKNFLACIRLVTPMVAFIAKEIGIWSDKDLPYPTDMPFQWTFVSWFMYIEIGIIFFLLLPFVSPSRWQKIFRSRVLSLISEYSHIYFNMFIVALLLLFFDSIREVYKYKHPIKTVDLKNNLETERLAMIKLFWAERNYYISGFTLFLWLVIRRLMILINNDADLMAKCEICRRETVNTIEITKPLTEEKNNSVNKGAENTDFGQEDSLILNLEETQKLLEKREEELKNTKADLETLKAQASNTNIEYDRLLKEHETLQLKMNAENSKKQK
uniref:Endoplasmic reticulum transmembrane protein n=1 Tax=Crassostrea virginica TaxID=6565 RepID=A0A8B8BG57_CRAVI|nr:B-cell receptor-associated protein 31-like isoform X1 [Crassostrea virginica]